MYACWELFNLFRQQHLVLVLVDDGAQFFLGDEELGASVLHHEVESLGGVGGVEGLIGAAGLHDA